MSQLPGGNLWNPRWQAFDSNGAILPLAELYAYQTGGTFSTLQDLYTTSALNVALSNPVVADAAGRFPAMFMAPMGYDLRLKDASGNTIWSCENVEDIGQTFLANLGTQMASGTFDVSSGYPVAAGDWLITTDAVATNPFIVNLPDLATWTTPLTICHQGSGTLRVTPAGTDQINFVAAYFTVPAASSPTLPTIVLLPASASWIVQVDPN